MAYLGGKAKNSEHILNILNDPQFDNMDYLEPFVGYCHILRRIKNKSSYTASDNNPLLISLIKGIKENKKVPFISKKRYYELKEQYDNHSFERAIACFTMSYNGKAWGGYVLNNKKSPSFKKYGKIRNYRQEGINYYNSLYKNPIFQKTKFSNISYEKINPKNKLIYCDPPYQNTTGYKIGSIVDFDSNKFWNIMRKWSKNNIVFISEYNAPKDFIIVSQNKKNSTISRNTLNKIREENLFIHKSLFYYLFSNITSNS